MKQILDSLSDGPLEFIPTKAPTPYTYQSNVVNAMQNVTLGDGKGSFLFFTAQYLNGKLSSCNKGSQVTITLSGVKLYSNATNVWRCLSSGGRAVKLNARGSAATSRADLGLVVVSAKHF